MVNVSRFFLLYPLPEFLEFCCLCTVQFINRAKKMRCIYTSPVLSKLKIKQKRLTRLRFLPEPMQVAFGRATFVMDLELSESRKLARVNVLHVMDSIQTRGFFIQVPPEGLINPNAVEPEGLRGA